MKNSLLQLRPPLLYLGYQIKVWIYSGWNLSSRWLKCYCCDIPRCLIRCCTWSSCWSRRRSRGRCCGRSRGRSRCSRSESTCSGGISNWANSMLWMNCCCDWTCCCGSCCTCHGYGCCDMVVFCCRAISCWKCSYWHRCDLKYFCYVCSFLAKTNLVHLTKM